MSLLTTLHDPNLRPGVPKHNPSSTETFLAVDTTPVESVALVPALVTLSYAYLLDKNYEGCRRELDRALKILTTHEGEKAASTTLVREHLGLLAYYERISRRPRSISGTSTTSSWRTAARRTMRTSCASSRTSRRRRVGPGRGRGPSPVRLRGPGSRPGRA